LRRKPRLSRNISVDEFTRRVCVKDEVRVMVDDLFPHARLAGATMSGISRTLLPLWVLVAQKRSDARQT